MASASLFGVNFNNDTSMGAVHGSIIKTIISKRKNDPLIFIKYYLN